MNRKWLLILVSIVICLHSCNKTPKDKSTYTETIQDFIDLRFGMFLCFNIMSFGAEWGESKYDISSFDPKNLDCEQWAKSAKSANMEFGLLTTKHHEGFCLWDSQVTAYDIASTPYKKDIVKQYVDAFRKADLKVGLYYSIWDSTHDIDKGKIDDKAMAFIKTQITELLSNYGTIDYFVIDGWFWRMGHHEVPYSEIRELIRELQPNCLVTDHTHLQAPYHTDIPYFEGPFGAFPSEGNIMPSALGHCSFNGNGWFWNEETPKGLKKGESSELLVEKLSTLESRYCNFMLNCMPNRDGLLDANIVELLNEIGRQWTPDLNRPMLNSNTDGLIYSVPIIEAQASSGEAGNLIDASQYGVEYKHWTSDSSAIQTINLDLGSIYERINSVQIIPNHRCKPSPETSLADGNILHMNTYTSINNIEFTKVAENTWLPNGHYREIVFPESSARYIKLEILEANGKNAIIAEIDIGSSFKPVISMNNE